MKRKSIELIAYDSNQNLQYQGKCKLQIDVLSKILLVEPENEEYKLKSVMFKWNFSMDKNFLFTFGEHESNDFALVFDEEKRCQKVYNFIYQKKDQNDSGKEMLLNRFVIPLKEKCIKLIKENNSSSSEKQTDAPVSTSTKNKIIDIIDLTGDDIERISNHRKRKRSQLKKPKNKDNVLISSKKENIVTPILHAAKKYIATKILKKPEYEISENYKNCLIIFDEKNKGKCWEFRREHHKSSSYYCRGCAAVAKLRHRNAEEEYVELRNVNHKCKTTTYQPKNPFIV